MNNDEMISLEKALYTCEHWIAKLRMLNAEIDLNYKNG